MQEEKQKEMESSAKRSEQLIDMQAERVYDLSEKEKRSKQLFELNADFEKSIRDSLDLLLGEETKLDTTAETMAHTLVAAPEVVQSAGLSVKNVSINLQLIACATEALTMSSTEISRQI